MDGYPIPADEIVGPDSMARRFAAGERFSIAGLWGSSAAFLVSLIPPPVETSLVIVAPDERKASSFREDLEFFLGEEVPLCPAYDPRTPDAREARLASSERIAILARILSPSPPRAVVMPLSALLDTVPSSAELEGAVLRLAPGARLDPAGIAADLERSAFERAPLVTRPGEFSLRGCILDVFPPAAARPVRVEFFDDEVESIRAFDLESQRSVARLEETSLILAPRKAGAPKTPFARRFPAATPVLAVEPPGVLDRLDVFGRELGIDGGITASVRALLEESPGCDLFQAPAPGAEISYTVLSARGIAKVPGKGKGEGGGRDPSSAAAKEGAKRGAKRGAKEPSHEEAGGEEGPSFTDLEASIEAFRRRCPTVRILCQVKAEAERLEAVLRGEGIRTGKGVRVEVGRVSEGFQFPAFGVSVVNHHELFRRLPMRRPPRRRPVRSRSLESFSELKPGDLVVHMVHGIGRFGGMTHMRREQGGEEDFLVLEFRDEVLLYVPASKIHLVHRYIGSGDGRPPLDRIGGSSWKRRRERVEEALGDLAAELLETEAVRAGKRGFAFAPDDDLQRLFDASFPYEDTEDQIEAMARIKDDMESPRPMDRLLCGDVGFGKTELAVRAAFKAASSGKQTAVLVPTTILAQQHYETFRTRLADYPVTVSVLSRFQTRARQEEIIREAREGRVDILIGTHRLLSPDVGFKDLGLLVIDEEQRFGVRHKERLKGLKKTVGVLTMTATPIPRTLHMALVGLRDISSLETPPEGRMPVHTRVAVRSDDLIRRAVLLEVSRGGQVFFLHNRVETIEREAVKLRRLVPPVRIAWAHGRMPERRLQEVIARFIERRIDVLLCTTIIESGIDMPQVNTMIIDRADTFGLADLHQLRGRVGRGQVKAYCYLLIPHRGVPGVAMRRLKAIEELSQLGAGFSIALKDLEIRGAGNILGVEQHGHIAAVGYELYCRLLKDTILKMTGREKERDFAGMEVDLDVRARAFLPASYIPDEGLRMEILRRLSECRGAPGFEDAAKELRDRFGPPPEEALRLIDLFRIRRRMIACGIRRIARAAASRELVLEIFDPGLFASKAPFERRDLRILGPRKAVVFLPRGTKAPEAVLDHLKSRLMAGVEA